MRSSVIGIGNELRRDDAVGLEISRQLQNTAIGMEVFLLSESFFELPNLLSHFDTTFIIDAVPPADHPGRISMKEYMIKPGLNHHRYSLHDMELFWGLQYAYHRGFGGRVFLIGVEGKDLSWGTGLSLSLNQCLPSLVEEVKGLIAGVFGS